MFVSIDTTNKALNLRYPEVVWLFFWANAKLINLKICKW